MHASKRDFRFCFLVWPSIFHVCMDYVKGGHLSLRVYGIGWMEGFSLKRKMVNHVFPCPCHWIWFLSSREDVTFFSCCPEPRPRSHSTHNHPPPFPFLPPLLSFGFTPSPSSPSQFCAIFWLPYSPLYAILYAIYTYPLRHYTSPLRHRCLYFSPSTTSLYIIGDYPSRHLRQNSYFHRRLALHQQRHNSLPTTPQLFANNVYILCPHQRHHGLPQLYAKYAIYVLYHLQHQTYFRVICAIFSFLLTPILSFTPNFGLFRTNPSFLRHPWSPSLQFLWTLAFKISLLTSPSSTRWRKKICLTVHCDKEKQREILKKERQN